MYIFKIKYHFSNNETSDAYHWTEPEILVVQKSLLPVNFPKGVRKAGRNHAFHPSDGVGLVIAYRLNFRG
jgi:hypothetical protein